MVRASAGAGLHRAPAPAESGIIFLWQSKGIEPMIEVFTSLDNLVIAKAPTAFKASIDDVDGRSEGGSDVVLSVDGIWFEETWFIFLRLSTLLPI